MILFLLITLLIGSFQWNFVASQSQNCTASQFNCGNGRCIPQSYVCDGDNDCRNYQDELNCARCPSNSGRCANGQCVRLTRICDGIQDCADNSDESNCSSTTTIFPTTLGQNCSQRQFDCGNGRCIPRGYVCDGDNDCRNYLDEINCASCPQSSSRCNNGQCIRISRLCDGTQDCADNSDEANCSSSTTSTTASSILCTEAQFYCGIGGIRSCIPLSWVCDGDNDCGNFVDESNCTSCPRSSSRCNNGQCIRITRICDGIQDCADNSDEANCSITTTTTTARPGCNETLFDCGDSARTQCIPLAWICDGDDDCGNFADENNCSSTTTATDTTTSTSCDVTEFDCRNGHCIPLRWFCDGDDDCGNGADEVDCPVISTEPPATLSPNELANLTCYSHFPNASYVQGTDRICQVLCGGNDAQGVSFARLINKSDGISCGSDKECLGGRCRQSADVLLCRNAFNGTITGLDNLTECKLRCKTNTEPEPKIINKEDGAECQGFSGRCYNGQCVSR